MEKSKTLKVKHHINEEIKAGRITPGQRLPSCRVISKLLGINKITANKAYKEFENEHKVYSIPSGGYYLLGDDESSTIRSKEIDFQTVKPDEKMIPYREFAHVINKAVDSYKNNLFSYESSVGLLSLRETLRTEFEKDDIYTSSDNIIITNGAQQAINLVFQTIFCNLNKNGKLLVEVPTYNLALMLAHELGINIVGIERKIYGYNFKEMKEIFSKGDISAFYVIPRHHNPTGYSLSESEKKKLVELCNKYNVLIIEDDYLADLGSKKGSLPVHYYDTSKNTIYIRSFSKTFMPGIRIGCLILPKFLIEPVANMKRLSDLNTARLTQVALELFIKSKMYEKHIKKVRKSYEAKLKKAKEIFNSLCPKNIIWNVPDYGIFIWLKVAKNIEINLIEQKLKNQGILIRISKECIIENGFYKDFEYKYYYIRLCISGVAPEDISSISSILLALKSNEF